MKAEVCRADPSTEFLTAEKCFILEVANDAGDPKVSIAWARVTAASLRPDSPETAING